MDRLTKSKTVKEMGLYELAHNCMFVRDGQTWYRDFQREIKLRDLIRKIIAGYKGNCDKRLEDDELLDGMLLENLQYPVEDGMDGLIAVFNMIAWALSDVREILKEYEDAELDPQQVLELKERDTAKTPLYEGDGYSDGEMVYDTWICPSCGKHYEVDFDDYDFCPKCGQRLRWEE